MMFWAFVIACGAAGYLAYLWLDTEAQWAREREEWARERERLQRAAGEHSPGGLTLYEAACRKASEAADRDFAATLNEIQNLPESE